MNTLLMILVSVGCLVLVVAASAVLVRRRLVVVTVGGPSMEPTFTTGDRVLVLRRRTVRRGDVVVLASPKSADGRRAGGDPGWYVKRVAALPGDEVPEDVRPVVPDSLVPDGRIVVLGDGARSADSRLWGYCPLDGVLGVVVRRLSRTSGEASAPGPSV
ncbi:signal peptidase I [Spirillospora sp. NPDC052269]